jgi:hypothetical protein
MENVNNPSLFSGIFSVAVNPIMALAAKCREILITSEPLSYAPRLVMYIVGGFVLATFAFWMEGKIRIFYLVVLAILLGTFFGCSPQPARSF